MRVKVLPALALVSLFLLLPAAQTQEKHLTALANSTSAAAPTIEDVLWWFPPDTETVMVARGPFQIAMAAPHASTERLLETLLRLSAVGNLTGPLEIEDQVAEDFRLPKALVGIRLQFAMEGSRNFRPPRSLGGMPYDGCSVMVFADEFEARGDLLLKNLRRNAHPRKRKVAGFSALVWKEKHEDDRWTFLLVRPQPNVFLVATQETYLKETLERMKSRGSARALPDSLPEWKYVDRQAHFWAMRHYDRRRAETDPSSPFGGKKAANDPDDQAIGIAFSYTAATGEIPTLYYFSSNSEALDIARGMWSYPREGLVPQAKQVTPGVVQITVPVNNENGIFMFQFVLSYMLGHGVYV